MVAKDSTSESGGACMDGRAALLVAEVRACNNAGVRGLLTTGVDPNSRDVLSHDRPPALYLATCLNSQDIAFLLLHHGADVNGATSWGNRPIHAAADLGHEGMLTLLLKHNDARGRAAEVNARNKNGDTALHLAAARGHVRICQGLLGHKADLWALNNRGRTARDEASSNGKSAVFQELYRHRRNEENLEASSPSTAPIRRRQFVAAKGPLITEPVRVRRRSRHQEPVESEDTSTDTSDVSISSSSSSSSSPPSSITSSSSSNSSHSSPSTSIALSVSSSDEQRDGCRADTVLETFEFETSQKQPLRTAGVKRAISCQDTVDSGEVGSAKPSRCSEPPHEGTAFDSYFEEIQLTLNKDDQLKILTGKCDMLVKKLAEKEKENALLRAALLQSRTLSHKVESHNLT